MKLNLACGRHKLEGYTNVDFEENHSGIKPDVAADVTKPLPFKENSVDEILAVHILEHFYIWEVMEVLTDWKRVLKPGGRLILEMPCLDKVIGFLTQNPLRPAMTFWALYGDPRHQDPRMTHRWCYAKMHLRAILEELGFKDIEYKEAQFHVPERDMRMEAVKP